MFSPGRTEILVYAALIRITIDPASAAAAAAAFTSDVLPRVRSAPGFVAGYWVEPVDGRGYGFVLFERREQALAVVSPAMRWAAPGVAIVDASVQRVAVVITA